ncbi:PP2C family protein-serine/threonine phosphatase [Populibacterium corticicola]|uniref:PP2C family protein-serine/threonine phosphatase n=1 Tax=Populibacterium corticicola TaxID=1812826 RepID=A0ABW5XGA5_9MICO
MTIGIRFSTRSDVGLVRANNQDSAFAGEQLLLVADGMGGHAGGEVASALCVASMAPLNNETFSTSDMLERLGDAVERARIDLVQQARSHITLSGMGTTVTALLLCENKLAMAHMGDSRGYLLRDGQLTQVTKDHTFVQHLVDTGKITPEEAETHPQRSVVMRVLGDFELDLIPDLSIREARPGDRWLLCSDGLSGFVRFETLEQTLRDVADIELCSEYLIQLALRGGGSDNITCIVADVVELDDDATNVIPTQSGPERKQAIATAVGSVALGDDVPVMIDQASTLSDSSKLLVGANERVNTVIAQAIARKSGEPISEPQPQTGSLVLPAQSNDETSQDSASGPASSVAPINDDDEEVLAAISSGAAAEPKRRSFWRGLVNTCLSLLLLGGLGYGAYYWGSQQYFVGVHDGKIAIFNGFPQSVGPVHLSSVIESSVLDPDDLDPYMSRQIYSTIRATSLNDARARIEHFGTEIADQAKQDKLAEQEKAQEDAQQEDPDSSDNATDISVTPNETETPSTDPTETPSPDVTDPAS